MFWLVVETFVLMAVFVAVGVLLGIGLKQVFGGGRRAVPALAGAPAPAPAPAGTADLTAPVVVKVAHADAAEGSVPVVEPIAASEAPEEAPAVVHETVAWSEPAPAPEPPAALAPSEVVIDAGRAATADQLGVRPGALAGPRDGRSDDLKLIKGIGPQNEARLNALGVFHFDQIAGWTPEEARWIGSYLAFPGRIEREDWIGQARILGAG